MASIRTAPGYTRFNAFAAQLEAEEIYDAEMGAFDAQLVSDDEAEPQTGDTSNDDSDDASLQREHPLTTDFNLQGGKAQTPAVIEDEEDVRPQDTSAEFLKWHHRLGHISPRKIQAMAKQGLLPRKLVDCRVPMCTACLYGKATRRPWRTKTPKNKDETAPLITKPGQCVSIDQLESTTPGLIAQLKGIPTKMRYKVATIYVDHHSRLSFVYLQKTTNAEETVAAKDAFERYAASHGVLVAHYHADNGRFADNKFKKSIEQSRGQTLSFCGVNAHFQNGVAERRIRELQDHARTILIHANTRWPMAINTHLWPYAIRVANDVLNSTPNLKTGNTPLNVFAGSTVATNPKHWYPLGCPVYVLNNNLQAGKKIDKWSDRSRVGIYLGPSPQHARTVALVLSLTTGLVSPQFHVRMDPTFQTLRTIFGGNPPKIQWQNKCHFIQGDGLQGENKNKRLERSEQLQGLKQASGASKAPTTDLRNQLPSLPGSHAERHSPTTAQDINPSEGAAAPQQQAEENQEEPTEAPEEQGTDIPTQEVPLQPQGEQAQQPPVGTEEVPPLRRSSRQRQSRQRLIELLEAELRHETPNYVAYEVLASIDDQSVDDNPLLAFAASADPDTMYYHEAMAQPDRKQFVEAMQQEVSMQTKNGNWSIVKRSDVPSKASILPAVWAMKRKRRIATREIYKWKARLNIDGSKQIKGVNYWETYAPVASWPTICLILTMAIVKNWHTRQIDYVLAYTQAEAETDNLYMKVPRGFVIPGSTSQDEYVLKIRKNIYGQKQAGRVWNKHLVTKLKSAGFKQSSIDDCVFYRGSSIYVLYTDDSILAGPDERELDSIIEDMKASGLVLTVEGDISDFLGVRIEKRSDGTVNLTQPHLIDQILRDLRLDKENVACEYYSKSVVRFNTFRRPF